MPGFPWFVTWIDARMTTTTPIWDFTRTRDRCHCLAVRGSVAPTVLISEFHSRNPGIVLYCSDVLKFVLTHDPCEIGG